MSLNIISVIEKQITCVCMCLTGKKQVLKLNNLFFCPKKVKRCNSPFVSGKRVRCTKCHFVVCQIQDYQWIQNVDYLFFRSYTPELNKLMKKLEYKKDAISYCCQCQWYTHLKGTTDTKKHKMRGWVCDGHRDMALI